MSKEQAAPLHSGGSSNEVLITELTTSIYILLGGLLMIIKRKEMKTLKKYACYFGDDPRWNLKLFRIFLLLKVLSTTNGIIGRYSFGDIFHDAVSHKTI